MGLTATLRSSTRTIVTEKPSTCARTSRRADAPYDRLTTYLLDPEGCVREIFRAHRRLWLPWDAVLHRIDELLH